MKFYYFFLTTLIIFSCRNGIRGSGNIVKETRPVTEINSISVSGAIMVDVKNGISPSIIIEADDNILPYVVTDLSDKNLSIKLKGINHLLNATVHIYVVSPNILKFKTSASAEIKSTEVISNAENLTFAATSGSQINVNVDAPAIFAEASSGSDIILTGRTKNVTTNSSSGSKVNLFSLHAENVSVSASSGAEIFLFASVSIIANASSGANVSYKGGASSVVKKISSGGTVEAE